MSTLLQTIPSSPAQFSKIASFEYMLKGLLVWYNECTGSSTDNDLSVLKSMKLLFFVTAASSNTNDLLINSIFNDFRAMPYGHVESDVYNEIRIRGGKLTYFEIDNKTTKLLPHVEPNSLDEMPVEYQVKTAIDNSIKQLKQTNPDLIVYNAYELVELSHSWDSWKKSFEIAKSKNHGSSKIEPSDVINENKNYFIVNF